MRSMTGFGVGDAALAEGRVIVETRAVNHRYLDVRVRLPKDFADASLFVEQVLRERLVRGRCEVVVRLEGAALPRVQLDVGRARDAMRALARLRDELAPGAELPLGLLASVPDLFVPPCSAEPDARGALRQAILASIADMDGMRDREGAALAADLGGRLDRVEALVSQIERQAPLATEGYRRRLRERARQLALPDVAVDPARLEQEVVLFAERSDVSEEVTRLRIHLAAARALCACGEPSGRKLDFLLQELGRETNTIGSKAQDAVIAQAVVEAKAELERMREQVQNVE